MALGFETFRMLVLENFQWLLFFRNWPSSLNHSNYTIPKVNRPVGASSRLCERISLREVISLGSFLWSKGEARKPQSAIWRARPCNHLDNLLNFLRRTFYVSLPPFRFSYEPGRSRSFFNRVKSMLELYEQLKSSTTRVEPPTRRISRFSVHIKPI